MHDKLSGLQKVLSDKAKQETADPQQTSNENLKLMQAVDYIESSHAASAVFPQEMTIKARLTK